MILGAILVFGGYYSWENIGKLIKSGFSSTGPTAALFVFSVLYFGIMTDAGMFDVIIGKLMLLVKDNVIGVCVMTCIIALIGHLDGGGASTFCIVVPAMLPVYKKMHMRPATLLRIAVISMGVLNLMPWAGPTMRAATVLDKEQPEGVIVQFGGQTAINLAGPLADAGVKILGSSVDSIDRAEDRERFEQLLTNCNIPRPKGHTVFDTAGALKAAADVGYPVMVRPSYVLGGRAMEIVYNDEELKHYMSSAVKASREHPVLVDHYLQGTEVEVDAICDGNEVLIPGIMEHIERAGVHSGDSIAVYPPRNLSESVIKTIIDYTNRMALGLEVKGMINIQYIVRNNEVYVIEVNPRSSRTVPFLSKVTNVPMINVATKAAMGHSLREQGYKPGLGFFPDYYAVKAPVFSFNKMSNVDITLGPEMKSTGEVMCVDYQYSRALYKACIASGINVPHEGSILITVADMDKPEAAEIAAGFADLGYEIMATGGTAEYLKEKGVKVTVATKVSEGSPNILDDIKEGRISMVINTTNHGRDAERDGFKIRRSTVEHAIACLTSMDTARELQHVMSAMRRRRVVSIVALQDLAWEG